MMKPVSFKHTSVESETLMSMVENTAPFLFEAAAPVPSLSGPFRYIDILRVALASPAPHLDADLISYYELCIAAHFATVGTFVPTDVDNAIRSKLWFSVHTPEAFEAMWNLVKDFATWDESPVSNRIILSPVVPKHKLSGHQGEWLSIATGAYGAALKVAPDYVQEVREAIEKCVTQQELALTALVKVFEENQDAANMKLVLGGVAAVAHNLGDLDRMIEAWELSENDVLKRRVFRMGHEDSRHPKNIFIKSGEFYQKFLAAENHRNFALRQPKPLRKSANYLLPYGPFLDEWGSKITRAMIKGEFNEGEFREIVEALILGWKRLNLQSIYHSQGYARALAGVQAALPKGRDDLENLLPQALRKEITEGGLRTHLSVSKKQFEEQFIRKLRAVYSDWIS